MRPKTLAAEMPATAFAARLGNVPFFAVTSADGDTPFFTRKRRNGSAAAVFFAERVDAEALLQDVRKKGDPNAVISAVPLDQAWSLVTAPNEAEWGGVFILQASRRQIVHANGLAGKDLELDVKNQVPVFFDRRLVLPGGPGGEVTFPLFFKLEDLETVFQKGAAAAGAAVGPDVKVPATEVLTLAAAVAAMRDGTVDRADQMVLVSSEAFGAW
jgi:hypothetical protein